VRCSLPILTLSALLAGCGFKVNGSATPADDQPPGDGPSDSDAPHDVGPPPPDTPEADALCLDHDDFCLRKRITVQPNMVHGGADLHDFPLLIVLLNDNDLKAAVRSDGNDIVFTSDDGTTTLTYDRQSYDPLTGSLVAWVRAPTISSTAPTDIYLYYGKSVSFDRQDAHGAWNSTYSGVWHLDGDAKDISGNNNDGTAAGIAFNSPGHIGASAKWEQATDRITIGNSSSLDDASATGTIEMWVNFVNPKATHLQILLSNKETFKSPSDGFSWATQTDGDFYFYPWVASAGSQDFVLTPAPFMADKWHFASVTYNFPTRKVALYVDGQALTLSVDGATANWTQAANVSDWLLGSNGDDPANYFLGSMDELRISNVARTPGWIQTEYDNQLAPSTFYAVGAQTQLTPN
jgi:hypothetical protein